MEARIREGLHFFGSRTFLTDGAPQLYQVWSYPIWRHAYGRVYTCEKPKRFLL